jgi:CDGSH-type Zn-finger protein
MKMKSPWCYSDEKPRRKGQRIKSPALWLVKDEFIKVALFTPRGGNPMSDVVIAQKAPYAVDVEAGKTYFWCACGRSANQPFCDGSHQGTELLPMKHTAESSKTLYFCGCKKTAKAPLCDGTHNGI